MGKRNYALATGAGIFYDDETDLTVLPGKTVALDKDQVGTRTRIAIQNNHLIEASKPSDEEGDKDNNKGKK